ncbi:copper chaperone PCu(A)C [Xylophilus sp. GOD-11R]|uniref:copper chaperone PCu(A)C n=1 Tax=Xylophilus sp. GOD-11R TaxID=3089814 RepID=UPI00298C536B|nr:copper chaperone PCu(A)C [Xylophilus sp. GOD-11R]WPB57712.1 copper chaperone PCu(A)C [Xylophilus sp. GOD-11R]
MNRLPLLSRIAFLTASLAAGAAAQAHITLPPGGATAGTRYDAAFRVGHACQGSMATNAVTVQLPEGFEFVSAQPRTGWTLTTSGRTVSWKAESAQTALPTGERAEFIVRGNLPARAGTLFFPVLQGCDKGSADWAQLPSSAQDKAVFPAARLEVLAAGVAPVEVKDAWIRTAVKGQSGTGGFMKLQAPSGGRLVGLRAAEAGVAEVHEMKMEGDVMRMRALPNGLELPARQVVELKPGGYHLMLTQLKDALPVGREVALTLDFVDLEGRKSSVVVKVPVLASAPGGGGAAAGHEHGMSGMKH